MTSFPRPRLSRRHLRLRLLRLRATATAAMPPAAALALACVAAALAMPSAGAQSPLYVDAVRGSDVTGNGSVQSPFQSLTHATAVLATAPTTTLRVRPGVYDAANGELFPIALPAQCTIEADPATVPAHSGLVRVVTTLDLKTTFAIPPSPVVAVTLRDLELSGGMFRGVQLTANLSRQNATLVLERVHVTQSRCVVAHAANGAVLTLLASDCRWTGVDPPVIVTCGAGSTATVDIDRSVVRGGIGQTMLLDAQGGGSIQTALRSCRLHAGGPRGVYAVSDNGGAQTVRIEHCLLEGAGVRVIGGTLVGALVDSVLGSGVAVQHVTVNSIFHQNRNDALPGTGPTWLWGSNLVQQPALGGLGGNLIGTAAFVAAAKDDWHLLPGSPGRDAGAAAHVTTMLDIDGDPRVSGAPDLGPDEVHDMHVRAAGNARPGKQISLRTTAAAGLPFALFLGTGSVAGSFGTGRVHLAGTIVDLGVAGTTDARGVGEVAMTLPNDAALLGQVFFWQGAYAAAPYLGANAWRMPIQP